MSDVSTDSGPQWAEGALEIKFGFSPDKKSEKNMKKSFTQLTSFISDIAIISKVAGDALGKIWNLGAKTLSIGIAEGTSGVQADVRGWEAGESRQLTDAMQSAMGTGAESGKVIAQLDKFTKAFQNPATEFGAKYITLLQEMMARYKVSDEQKQEMIDAFKSGDEQGALNAFVDIMGGAGEEASNLAESLGLGALAGLENDKAMSIFLSNMDRSTVLYEANESALLDANDALSTMRQSMTHLARDLTVLMSGPLKSFSDWFAEFVIKTPTEMWQEIKDRMFESVASSNSILGSFMTGKGEESANDLFMKNLMKTLPEESYKWNEWLANKNEYLGTNFRSVEGLAATVASSGRTKDGYFDNEEWTQKIELLTDRANYFSQNNAFAEIMNGISESENP